MATQNTSTATHNTTVKVSHDGDIRRFTIPAGDAFPSFSSLRKMCAGLFQLTGEPRLFYTDSDGDRITMASEPDLIEAVTMLQEAITNGGAQLMLRLEIVTQLTSNQTTSKRSYADVVEAKIHWLATSLSCDTNEARDVIHNAVDGDGQAMAKILEAKMKHRTQKKTQWLEKNGQDIMEKKIQWLASFLGSDDVEGAKALIHDAINGDESALTKILEAKKQKLGRWGGKGGCGGKGHGGKGRHGCRPLVHALVRLTGMDRDVAREAIDGAQGGDQAAQAKIAAALEAAGVSSSDTSSDSGAEGGSCRPGVALLQLLARGELDAFEAAREELGVHHKHGRMFGMMHMFRRMGGWGHGHGKGECKGKGGGKGFGKGDFGKGGIGGKGSSFGDFCGF